MKKYIITLVILFLLQSLNLYPNFKCIMDGNLDFNGDTLKFYMYHKRAPDAREDSGILMVTSDEKIILKEILTDYIKFYTPLNTGFDWRPPLKYFVSEPPLLAVNNTYVNVDRVYLYGDTSIAQIMGIASIPEFLENFNIDSVPGVENSIINSVIVAKTVDESHLNTDRILYFVTDKSIVKIFNNAVVVNVPLPNELIPTTLQTTNLLYSAPDSLLVFTRNDDGLIGFYNIYTKDIKSFNYKNLPVGESFKIIKCMTLVDIDDKLAETIPADAVNVNIGCFVLDSSNFKLLLFNKKNKAWKVENIGYPSNSVVYDKSIYPEIDSVFNWPYSSDMIAVSFKADPTSIHDVHSVVNNQGSNLRSLCLYNLKTKGWTDFLIPLEVFKGYTPDMDYLLHPKQISWYRVEPKKTIGILYDHFLIEYDPYNSSITDITSTNNDINIYPNPITRISTVDIMCYVQDLSKIDIGLYDVLGTKILDLNNNYEYNSTTHTITTTIEVPPGTPSGTYYLNVRNGSEFKTRAVVIGK